MASPYAKKKFLHGIVIYMLKYKNIFWHTMF